MNISYIDFWPGFDVNSNWFNLLLKGTFPDREFNFGSNPEEADVIFFSCFGSSHKNFKDSKAIKILYIGENERPNYSVADYSLSFDLDDYNGRNFRLPHWYLYINWWDEPNFPHASISINQLSKKFYPEEVWKRKEFCSIMIGNPVQNRIDTAVKLNTLKPVHGYGRVFNNPYDGDKVKLLENYRWNICFENSITEGYVTEKLLQAKVAGCIPLYYGSDVSTKDFNKNGFIDITNSSLQEIYDIVVEYESDKSKFDLITTEPLFDEMPSLFPLYKFLQDKIK